MDYQYQYDAAGNIIQRTTEDGDYLYGYDALDRLTAATPPLGQQQGPGNPDGLPLEQYTYDGVHNRKTSAHQPGPWAYNDNNELQSYGIEANQESYEYDANGNTRLQKTGTLASPSKVREFLYNAAERLSEIKDNGATIAKYQYDPMGRRFKKEVNGKITWFQYADEGLIAEFTQNGTLTRAYGWKPGNLWGTDPVWLADISGATWTLNFYHNDHLGTSQRLTSIAGNVTWKAVSEAFGKTLVTTNATDNPLRFPGQYADIGAGFHYNHYRDYLPSLGRYSEFDPAGSRTYSSWYAYANDNPLNFTDVMGRLTDGQCCDMAQSSLAQKRHGGGVFCCDGRAIPCVKSIDKTGSAKIAIESCIKKHEQDHIDEKENEACEQCLGFSRPNGSPNYREDPRGSECKRTRDELLECLAPKYEECKKHNDYECKSQVRAYFNGKVDDMHDTYQCTNVPSKIAAE